MQIKRNQVRDKQTWRIDTFSHRTKTTLDYLKSKVTFNNDSFTSHRVFSNVSSVDGISFYRWLKVCVSRVFGDVCLFLWSILQMYMGSLVIFASQWSVLFLVYIVWVLWRYLSLYRLLSLGLYRNAFKVASAFFPSYYDVWIAWSPCWYYQLSMAHVWLSVVIL